MPTTLPERVCRVVVGRPLADYKSIAPNAVEIEGLRVQFKITKAIGSEPNSAEVSIYNLAESTRAGMQAKGGKVIVSGGFASSGLAILFSGDTRTIDHTHSGPDVITKIQASDGGRAYQFARVSKSFAAGVRVAEVIRYLADAMGLDPGNVGTQTSTLTAQFVSGFVAHGSASRELERVLLASGFEWSIQDGRLQVLKPGEALREEAVDLDGDSGLIGSPEWGSPPEKGKPQLLKIKSLLQPKIRPGRKFRLKSREHAGIFRAVKVEHSGDTHGGEWYTSIEASAT